jgi:hypothetical protein
LAYDGIAESKTFEKYHSRGRIREDTKMKKILLCIFACVASFNASAVSYADIWWNPSESGWGVTFSQQQSTIFATFFIYGADGKPTWVTALLKNSTNAQTVFAGPVYSATGTPFSAPQFNPASSLATQVGSATVTFQNAVRAQLTYSINGVQISKSIERSTLAALPVAGSYIGLELQRDDLRSEISGVEAVLSKDVSLIVSVTGTTIKIEAIQRPYDCSLTGTFVQLGTRFSASGQYECRDLQSGTWTSTDLTIVDDNYLIGTLVYSRAFPAPFTVVAKRWMVSRR